MLKRIIVCVLLIAALAGLANYRQLQGSVSAFFTGHDLSDKAVTSRDKVKLWVTADYGSMTIWSGEIETAPGQDLLDLMKKHMQVGTGYGGGFVKTINGFPAQDSSPASKDWFLYIDGILSDKGAGEAVPANGQVVWWDFHGWDGTTFVPASIGAYPRPLSSEIIIAAPAGEDSQKAADQVAKIVGGKTRNKTKLIPLTKGWTPESYKCPVIVIGAWPELSKIPAVTALFQRSVESGIFCGFKNGDLLAYDEQGRVAREFGAGCGCLVASGSGLGDTSPVWIISSTDRQGMESVIRLLREHPEKVSRRFGLVAAGSEILALPAKRK
ncbi:MAG: DUF4430 domain-containing protein [Acidobacteriota bacterium]